MKKYLIGSTLVAVAMGWIVIPFCQSQTGALAEECPQLDCEVAALSDPTGPVDFCVPADDQEAIPAVRPVLTQSVDQALSNWNDPPVISSIFLPARNTAAHNFTNAPTPVAPPARNEPQMVTTRKHSREMGDNEMDGTCGGITGSFDMTQSGNLTLNDNSVTSVALSGQAQQNLSSVVNIISIESTVSVMLNLNVNINSTVGTVNQGNTGTQNTGVQNTLTTVHP